MSKYWSNFVYFDSHDFEGMFSNEDGIHNFPTYSEVLDEDSQEKLDSIREVLEELPPREADFIDLYFFKKVTQLGIADLFGVSQPTVCYRLAKAAKRLSYIINTPNYPISSVEEDLRGVLTDELDINIMLLMLQKTCQSEVARELNVSQGLVRYRFMRNLKQIKNFKDLDKTIQCLEHVSNHFNILKDTNRSKLEESITYSL